jgi:phosphate transport system substrate-binding protein
MMHLLRRIAVLLFTFHFLLFTLSACVETPRPTPTPTTLRIAASSTTSRLLDDLSAIHRADHPWVTIELTKLNNRSVLELLTNGAVDLAFVSWLPDDLDPQVWRSAIAYDAVAVIVNAANPVEGLSLAQLWNIFQGRVSDWSAFGWNDTSLTVVSRESGSGTREAFEQEAMQDRPVSLNAIIQPGSAEVVDFVARTPGAIGYVSRAWVGDSVKAIAIEGVDPGPANAASGVYPIGRALYVLAPGEPTGAAREFVIWLLGDDGQTAIAERGFGRVR